MKRHLSWISAIAGVVLTLTAIGVNWTRIAAFLSPPGCAVTIRAHEESACVEFIVSNEDGRSSRLLANVRFEVLEYNEVQEVHEVRELERTLMSAEYSLRIAPEDLQTAGWETTLPIRQEVPAGGSDAFTVCIEVGEASSAIRPLSAEEFASRVTLRVSLFDVADKRVAEQEVILDLGQIAGAIDSHRIVAL